jgi:hypothetical protein
LGYVGTGFPTRALKNDDMMSYMSFDMIQIDPTRSISDGHGTG